MIYILKLSIINKNILSNIIIKLILEFIQIYKIKNKSLILIEFNWSLYYQNFGKILKLFIKIKIQSFIKLFNIFYKFSTFFYKNNIC